MGQSSSHPNVLFIMADQHRFDYLGCAGAEFLRTPNLDRLAQRGIRFTNCFTNCPVCAPARIGLATGLQPSRLGALDNASYLPQSVSTQYQLFRAGAPGFEGYRVGCVGKLDLAKPSPYNGRYGDRPCIYGWGFTHPEECEGKMHAGSSPTPIGPYTHFLQGRGLLEQFHRDYRERRAKGWIINASHDSVLPADAFEDVYIGQRAVRWLEWVPDDFPWYFFVSFVGPHDPFDPPTEYADRYRNVDVPAPIRGDRADKPSWVQKRMIEGSEDQIAVTRRQYCAAIEVIDTQVGHILDALARRGVLEDTIIVFTSDHGEMLGDHGLYTKSVAYEPSLHIPLLVSGPGIEGGRTSDALIELIDLHPTLCELAGLGVPQQLDAHSLAPILAGAETEHRTEIVSAIRHFRCIRTRAHKLIQNYNDLPELYNLEDDPQELENVAERQDELVRSLSARLRERFVEGQWCR